MPKENDALNTPVMKQYLEVKKSYPDAILFFRMGDFYEMFLEDAVEASAILDITLTKRQNQIPMAGIPFHSTESYISRLIGSGKTVVICEQTGMDKDKKIMLREVVRVITPGTVIEDNLLSGYKNNFLGIVSYGFDAIHTGFADVSTGDIFLFSFSYDKTDKLSAVLCKYSPSEIIIPADQKTRWEVMPFHSFYNATTIDYTDGQNSGFDAIQGMLEFYLGRNFRENPFQFKTPVVMEDSSYLGLDEQTIRNLELVENRNESHHTLLHVLNKCHTARGKRILKQRILFPERNRAVIENRWAMIDLISANRGESARLKDLLSEFPDIERILSRFRAGKAFPRDFRAIQKAIDASFQIAGILEKIKYPFRLPDNDMKDVKRHIDERLSDDELPALVTHGNFLKTGFSQVLDKARNARDNSRDLLLELESREKKRSGLNTLKIKYNKIVGYFVELSRNQSGDAPGYFIKKQTLVSSERFSFPELDELEKEIIEADEIIQNAEKEEFEKMVLFILQNASVLEAMSDETSELDFIISLTDCGREYKWVKPEINDIHEIAVSEGRHPVIEKFLPVGERFVPNDIRMNGSEAIAILTGPNMAGKSTFMRQAGLIQILFQMGSWVPASSASLFIADRVFTRIGSGDNLTAGESTFYVEMKESADILNNATKESLILFDEVGRGTSTYDGLSIAWGILEYLAGLKEKPRTIFATHYHELTELEREDGIFNLFLDTREKDGEVIFLKKVKKGKANKSFGIYVAKIAGIPEKVITRAAEILSGLEAGKKEIRIKHEQPLLFNELIDSRCEDIKNELKKLDINKMTPVEALQTLQQMQSKLK